MLILIADDEPETCVLVSAIVKRAGYDSITAHDAMQTLVLAAQRLPDLIVLDVMMPAGTGIGALEKLKLSTRTAHIPVVVLSGVTDPARVARVQELGAKAFLPKPVDADALLDVIRDAIRASD